MPQPKAQQLAADLLGAAASRLAEVRITALAEGVFYAVAVVEGPGGTVEVDARPSDAINLAVLAGVPIRVDAAILDDPVVDSHPEWAEYPARLADLAVEERQRRADFQARLSAGARRPGATLRSTDSIVRQQATGPAWGMHLARAWRTCARRCWPPPRAGWRPRASGGSTRQG